MQKQQSDNDSQKVAEFEQCPVCESYDLNEDNTQYCCERCGIIWIAVRRWE